MSPLSTNFTNSPNRVRSGSTSSANVELAVAGPRYSSGVQAGDSGQRQGEPADLSRGTADEHGRPDRQREQVDSLGGGEAVGRQGRGLAGRNADRRGGQPCGVEDDILRVGADRGAQPWRQADDVVVHS